MSIKRRKPRYYSDSFRNHVLSRVLSGEFSVIEASRHFGITGNMTIYRWLDKYAPQWREEPAEIPGIMSESSTQNKDVISAEIQSLKRLLEAERLRSESYLMMIKLAEEKHGILIEKKSGAKQSKR